MLTSHDMTLNRLFSASHVNKVNVSPDVHFCIPCGTHVRVFEKRGGLISSQNIRDHPSEDRGVPQRQKMAKDEWKAGVPITNSPAPIREILDDEVVIPSDRRMTVGTSGIGTEIDGFLVITRYKNIAGATDMCGISEIIQ